MLDRGYLSRASISRASFAAIKIEFNPVDGMVMHAKIYHLGGGSEGNIQLAWCIRGQWH